MFRQSPEAFEELLREHLDFLYRCALRLTRQRLEAEDLVQETAARALRHFDRYRPGTNARAWLLTVMRNIFINGYRRKAKERELMRSIEADARVVRKTTELPERVERTLDALPEEQRLALSLFYAEGFSYAEIARAMECPIGTVMSRLHAGRKKLLEQSRDLKNDEL